MQLFLCSIRKSRTVFFLLWNDILIVRNFMRITISPTVRRARITILLIRYFIIYFPEVLSCCKNTLRMNKATDLRMTLASNFVLQTQLRTKTLYWSFNCAARKRGWQGRRRRWMMRECRYCNFDYHSNCTTHFAVCLIARKCFSRNW